MRYGFYFIAFLLITGTSTLVDAQTSFYLNGLGRAVVTNDKLKGEALDNDTVTERRGAGGYTLFDLKANLEVNKNFRGNAILRVRNTFGAFWGLGAALNFRQLQLMGTIENKVKYEIGDINVGMTPYTVYNPNESYNKYEADVFRIRRNILEYENFIFDNKWRLQGVQLNTNYMFKKGIQKIGIKAFGTRTNPTNETTVPDRVLAGASVNVVQSNFFEIGGNYVGLLDIPIQKATMNYQNEVFTGDAKLKLDKEKVLVVLKGESGFSNYRYEKETTKQTVSSFNDFFYDVNLSGEYKPVGIKLFASYKDVGPQFSSPSAQTTRVNMSRPGMLFPSIFSNTTLRPQSLFDRTTQENIYNRSISPTLLYYLPQYGNINPYGPATPNRKGFTFGVTKGADKSIFNAEAIADVQTEIVGFGNPGLRKFMGVRSGFMFNLGRLIGFEKSLTLNAGTRYEHTTRDGTAQIDFTSTLIDGGITWELFKKFDLIAGVKKLNAKGNEFITVRDEFNTPSSFPEVIMDLDESIYSLGFRVRFSTTSFFTVNYNLNQYRNKSVSKMNYQIHQAFVNYTVWF